MKHLWHLLVFEHQRHWPWFAFWLGLILADFSSRTAGLGYRGSEFSVFRVFSAWAPWIEMLLGTFLIGLVMTKRPPDVATAIPLSALQSRIARSLMLAVYLLVPPLILERTYFVNLGVPDAWRYQCVIWLIYGLTTAVLSFFVASLSNSLEAYFARLGVAAILVIPGWMNLAIGRFTYHFVTQIDVDYAASLVVGLALLTLLQYAFPNPKRWVLYACLVLAFGQLSSVYVWDAFTKRLWEWCDRRDHTRETPRSQEPYTVQGEIPLEKDALLKRAPQSIRVTRVEWKTYGLEVDLLERSLNYQYRRMATFAPSIVVDTLELTLKSVSNEPIILQRKGTRSLLSRRWDLHSSLTTYFIDLPWGHEAIPKEGRNVQLLQSQ